MPNVMRSSTTVMALAVTVLSIVCGPGVAGNLRLEKDGKTVDLTVRVPSYGPPPAGFIYGGAHPAPYPFYLYGWPPSFIYAPRPGEVGAPVPTDSNDGQEHIPVGQIIILVDPVSAEVFLDGLRLNQRDDLSYAAGLIEGRHRVEVEAEGYIDYDKTINVSGGRGKFLTIRLTPKVQTPTKH